MSLSMPSLEDFAELGAIEHGRPAIRERVLGAWDAFLEVAEGVDLEAKSRLPGWRAHEICVHLGAWDDYQPVDGVLAAARAAQQGDVPDHPPNPDETNAAVTKAHRDASRDEVLAALHRARDEAADYLAKDDPQELDRVLVCATVGPLPALTILHAQIYELAVHSLDLHDCGAPDPAKELLDSGLAALSDASGALAARVGIDSAAGIRSDVGAWAFCSNAQGWQIGRWESGSSAGPAAPGTPTFDGKLPVRVEAPVRLLLEASAGRANPLKAVVTRRIKVHGLPGLLKLAPIVETVPGIPGGPALRVAAKGLAGAGGALSRLTRR
jgi:uncharacterized protein (TIGR03083 family)